MGDVLPTRSQAKKIILLLIVFQLLIGTSCSLLFLYLFGLPGFKSAMMGVASVCAGSLYVFIRNFFGSEVDINASFRVFYRSSMIKLLVSAIVAGAFIVRFDVIFLPFMAGIIATLMAYLFMLVVETYLY